MWENLAIQIPIVAAFVWFVLEMDKRNAAYARSRDEQWREFLANQSALTVEALGKVTASVEAIDAKFDAHDRMMSEAIISMQVAAKIRQAAVKEKASDSARRNKAERNL